MVPTTPGQKVPKGTKLMSAPTPSKPGAVASPVQPLEGALPLPGGIPAEPSAAIQALEFSGVATSDQDQRPAVDPSTGLLRSPDRTRSSQAPPIEVCALLSASLKQPYSARVSISKATLL